MKKNLLLLVSVATVVLSGCSNEEIVNVETSMQNAIGFNVVGSNPGTRVNPITNGEDLKKYDFDVFAFETGKTGEDVTPFMGKHVDVYSHEGVNISWKESKWDYTNAGDLAYWPTVGLDFYAVSPAKGVGTWDMWLIHSNEQKVQYELCDEFSSNHTHKNVDLMYATAFSQTKATNNGKVKLTFKHALSQVLFRARTEKEGMEVVVGKMQLYNAVVGNGVFTFPKQNVAVSKDNWSLTALEVGGGSICARDENASQTTVGYAADSQSATWLSDVDMKNPGNSDVLMMFPQTLMKWATLPGTPVSIETANKDEIKQCYLAIECSIKQNGLYVFGSADQLKTLYVPFSAEWQPGYRYIYTLIFGGGYDDQGKPILTPIEFDTKVEEWTNSEIDSNLVPTGQN